MKLVIPKQQLIKIEKAANRLAHIELKVPAPKSSIYKNKKAYSRKSKHKLQYD